MSLPAPMLWKDLPDTSTPLTADTLNAWSAAILALAQAAEAAAAAAQASAASATLPTDGMVTSVLTTPGSSALTALPGALGSLSVRSKGAVGDGVADDTAAIQAALANAFGATVVVPAGTWKVTGLTLASGATLVVLPGATIRGVTAAASVITAQGTETAPVSVTVNTTLGSRTITAPGHGLVAGDLFRLGSTSVYDASSTSSTIGELLVVESVASSVITTQTPIVGGPYTTTASATVSKITPAQGISIYGGGTIRGNRVANAEQLGLTVRLARSVRIRDITFADFDQKHVLVRDCTDVGVEACRFDWASHAAQAYGVSFSDATQDSWATSCTFVDVRHSLSTNNSTAGKGIPRRIRFEGNTVQYTYPASGGAGGDAIDTHSAAEDIWIERNTVVGSSGQGINVECRSCRVVGNRVINAASNGIQVHNESDQNGLAVVRDNHVISPALHGIIVQGGTRGTVARYERIDVRGNIVEAATGAVDAFRVGNSAATNSDLNVTVVDNAAIRCTVTNLFAVRKAQGLVYRDNLTAGSTGAVVVDDPTGKIGNVSATTTTTTLAVDPQAEMVSLAPAVSTTGTVTNITGGRKGQVLSLRSSSGANTITLTHGSTTDGLRLNGATNYALTGQAVITFWYAGTQWIEVSRST